MKVGSLVFATEQGLGILAKAFYDHKVVTDPVIVRHGSRINHLDWYPPDTPTSGNINSTQAIWEQIKHVDVMLFFETPFNWEIVTWCKRAGVKTVLMTMYECTPEVLPVEFDLYLCPSLLDLQYFPKNKSQFITVPVEMEWRQRTVATTFVHNSGHGGLKGRNGTAEFLQAIQYVKSPANYVIRSQSGLSVIKFAMEYKLGTWFEGMGDRIKVCISVPYNELFTHGDVFVFPERFNGLSLPLQEAYASGMLVMGTDRYPMNTWLPTEPLITPVSHCVNRVSPRCKSFEESIVSPKSIAAKIDEWYGKDISEYSLRGKKWAEENSWEVLRPEYMKALS